MKCKEVTIKFKTGVDTKQLSEDLFLAAVVADILHGKEAVMLHARYRFRKSELTCRIDTSTEVGETIARVFVGFVRRAYNYGEHFSVQRPEWAPLFP